MRITDIITKDECARQMRILILILGFIGLTYSQTLQVLIW